MRWTDVNRREEALRAAVPRLTFDGQPAEAAAFAGGHIRLSDTAGNQPFACRSGCSIRFRFLGYGLAQVSNR